MRDRLWKLITPAQPTTPGAPDASQANAMSATTPRSFMPYMGTFHGICVRILHIEADAAGIDRNFTIYDSEDQLTLIRRIMRAMNIANDKTLTPKAAHGMISHWQNLGKPPPMLVVRLSIRIKSAPLKSTLKLKDARPFHERLHHPQDRR